MCSRHFFLPNINGYPQPWALSLQGIQVLISPRQPLASSLQIPANGAGEKEGFALPSNLHTGCVHPARAECAAVTAAH